MTSYIEITDGETDPGAPATSELAKKWRDNPIAMAEGAMGAPPIIGGWYPYDMEKIGDGNDGTLWDFSVDGAVSSVETPTFESGFDYLIVLDNINFSSNNVKDFVADLYKSVNAAYQSVTLFSMPTDSGINSVNGSVTLVENDYVKTAHVIRTPRGIYSGSSLIVAPNAYYVAYDSTPQIISKMRIRVTAGNMNAGKILLYRRGGIHVF